MRPRGPARRRSTDRGYEPMSLKHWMILPCTARSPMRAASQDNNFSIRSLSELSLFE